MNRNQRILAFALWLLLPFSGIIWLYITIGWDMRLLYLAAVTILPAALAFLGPLVCEHLEEHDV